MTDLAHKEIKYSIVLNRTIRNAIKHQIWQRGKWDIDIVMEALGVEPDTDFGKAIESYAKAHGEMIENAVEDEVFHEKQEAAHEEAEKQRLIQSHQPTLAN